MAVPGNKREIDYLKAFAIILVVFYHVIFFSDIYWYNLFYICLCITLRNVHVPLFFLLAGYLCHKQEVKGFYRKKIRRILIPFLFMSCLKLLFTNLVSPEFLHANSIPLQLYDAFVCGNLYWFSYCLLIMFLLAPLFWNKKGRIWALLIVALAANILIRRNGWPLTDVLQIAQVIAMFPYFLLGMLMQQYDMPQMLKRRNMQWYVLGGSLLIAGICGYFRFHEDVNDAYYIDFLMGISIMALLWELTRVLIRVLHPGEVSFSEGKGRCTGKCRGSLDRILRGLGKYSYQIMLLDALYRWIFFEVLQRIFPVNMGLIVLVTFLTLLFSGLTCVLLKRIPGISYLIGLKEI